MSFYQIQNSNVNFTMDENQSTVISCTNLVTIGLAFCHRMMFVTQETYSKLYTFGNNEHLLVNGNEWENKTLCDGTYWMCPFKVWNKTLCDVTYWMCPFKVWNKTLYDVARIISSLLVSASLLLSREVMKRPKWAKYNDWYYSGYVWRHILDVSF